MTTDTQDTNVVTKAINRFGLTLFARYFKVSHQAVRKWEKYQVPAERVPRFSEVTGYPRHEIRADLYESPPGTEAE